jgi:hypothetical protein
MHVDSQGRGPVTLRQAVLSDADLQERRSAAAHVRRDEHRSVARGPEGSHVLKGIAVFSVVLRGSLSEVIGVFGC